MSAGMLALLQATDRNGQLAGRLDVSRWPVTVGRALDNDMVLGDSHLAASHLRIDRSPEGEVRVEVLDTANGIALDAKHYMRGEVFVWPAGTVLSLGRLKLGLRLAEEPVGAEEPLAHFRWGTVGWTLLAVGAMLAAVVFEAWLMYTDTAQLPGQLLGLIALVALVFPVWAGFWALLTKLFTGRLQFWRHVRIAGASTLLVQAVVALCGMLAFMFSLENLAKFANLQILLGLAVAVYLHLAVVMPHSRRKLGGTVAGVALLLMVGILGTSWLQNKRLSNTLHMSVIYPPGWRMAPAVPVSQFLQEAGDIRRRLDQRLKDKDQDGEGLDGSGESE